MRERCTIMCITSVLFTIDVDKNILDLRKENNE